MLVRLVSVTTLSESPGVTRHSPLTDWMKTKRIVRDTLNWSSVLYAWGWLLARRQSMTGNFVVTIPEHEVIGLLEGHRAHGGALEIEVEIE